MPERFTLASEFTDPGLERALVATIAARPQVYWEVLDLLPSEAFTRHRGDFEKLAAAIEGGGPLPVIAGELLDEPVEAAQKLTELYKKRLLADICQGLLENMHAGVETTSLLTQLEEGLVSVQQASRELRAGQMVALSDLLPKVLEDVKARRQAVEKMGIGAIGLPTGLGRLDKLLGGLQTGLHLLAAEPGQGKTTFALQIAVNIAMHGYPALFISFEEALSRLALKALCGQAGLEMKKFTDGYGDPAALERAILEYGPKLSALHLLEGTAQVTATRVRARALEIMSSRKVNRCLIVVDYLQRWAASRGEFTDFRHKVSTLVSELRELALRLDIPVLVISSQNRLGQGTARLTSLKESGELEYSADTALFLVESKEGMSAPPARAVDLVIEKNRYGDVGTVKLIFRPDLGIFKEVVNEL